MMTATKWIPDKYTRRARLQPALFVVMPAGFALFGVLDSATSIPWWESALVSVFASCGGMQLLSQLARDRGRSKEPELYTRWGGKPTTRLLRFRDNPNEALRERRYKKLQKIVRDLKLPTAKDEAADPSDADGAYEACAARLRELTRNQTKFPLIFEENCNYGYRRNLWGMKPVGLAVNLVGIAIAGTAVVLGLRATGVPLVASIACLGADLLILPVWLFRITPDWVRIPADAYADRLLSACEILPSK